MGDDLGLFKAFVKDFKVEGRPFFDGGEIACARAPGRLDVMGGIADYSGSLVLEMPIAEGMFAAVQIDREPVIRIASLRVEGEVHFSMPLADFRADGRPIEYAAAVRYFREEPGTQWAAYIAGAFLVLMRERGILFNKGARILVRSDVPEGVGVSSSAAVEVAAMLAIARAFDILLDPSELARLCQVVENRVAGAPCGIMDQMTVVHGRAGKLLALLCQPAEIQGTVDIPEGLRFWGINFGIRHAVSGSDYGAVRAGAFMGLKIIQAISGESYGGYLANVTPSEFEERYRRKLPEELTGVEFLDRYGALPDEISTVDPDRRYAVLQPTLHPVYENFRVRAFARLLEGDPGETGPILGELMFQSHASYSACGLGSEETDLLVELVRRGGGGLHGAKITGGGSGGTVVVLGEWGAEAAVREVVDRYEARAGHRAVVFDGSSEGAVRQASVALQSQTACQPGE